MLLKIENVTLIKPIQHKESLNRMNNISCNWMRLASGSNNTHGHHSKVVEPFFVQLRITYRIIF